jgi:hypothetical protein
MKAGKSVSFAELHYSVRLRSVDTWSGERNRPTLAGYDIRLGCVIPHPAIGGGVMPSRLSVSPRIPNGLRQKPTSKRRGKAVGKGLASQHGSMRYSARARRRVFVVASEGWMQ